MGCCEISFLRTLLNDQDRIQSDIQSDTALHHSPTVLDSIFLPHSPFLTTFMFIEAEDYKKQVNTKGREINKRERKSKRDEETIRMVSRERDAMGIKLKKMTEQMEYYKGMVETKWVFFFKQLPFNK